MDDRALEIVSWNIGKTFSINSLLYLEGVVPVR